MRLNGGIDEYRSGSFYKDNKPACGRKVKYLDDNGYPDQPESARKVGLVKDSTYTVNKIYVGSSSSTVELQEFTGHYFNTVMFEDV